MWLPYVQFDDLWNVDCLSSRYLFCLHEEFAYNLYSSDQYVYINKEERNIVLSFLN